VTMDVGCATADRMEVNPIAALTNSRMARTIRGTLCSRCDLSRAAADRA
jgi:hypothetical protein